MKLLTHLKAETERDATQAKRALFNVSKRACDKAVQRATVAVARKQAKHALQGALSSSRHVFDYAAIVQDEGLAMLEEIKPRYIAANRVMGFTLDQCDRYVAVNIRIYYGECEKLGMTAPAFGGSDNALLVKGYENGRQYLIDESVMLRAEAELMPRQRFNDLRPITWAIILVILGGLSGASFKTVFDTLAHLTG